MILGISILLLVKPLSVNKILKCRVFIRTKSCLIFRDFETVFIKGAHFYNKVILILFHMSMSSYRKPEISRTCTKSPKFNRIVHGRGCKTREWTWKCACHLSYTTLRRPRNL